MASINNDTYVGALQILARQLTDMKALPDCNLPFVVGLETQVLGEIRSPERKAQEAGLIPSQGANPMGNSALGLPGAPPMDPGMGGGGGMSAPPSSMMGAGAPPGVSMAPPAPTPQDMAALMGGM